MLHKGAKDLRERAKQIVSDAGGEVVGRTRIQKMAYLLELAGEGSGFKFAYKHYGPYSQPLADSLQIASLFDEVKEEKRQTEWGTKYSIYTADPNNNVSGARQSIISLAKSANAVELELAATAAFLSTEGFDDPWEETVRRKPEKSDKLEGAKELYSKLREIKAHSPWPDI